MRVSLRIGATVALAVAIGVVPVARRAAHAGIDDPSVGYTLHFFSDVDGVDVYSQYGDFGMIFMRDATLNIQWGHDTVIIPGIEAAPGTQEAVDAITSASRPIAGTAAPYEDFVKIRDEVQSTVTYGRYRASYYVSTESDYFAQMVTVNYNRDFMADNFNLSGGVSFGWDDIKPLADDDTPGIADYRQTLHGNLVATQILTPLTVVRVGGEFNSVKGLQHDPYRNVYVAGTNVPELHPKDRNRWSASVGVNQYITNRSSIKIDYRYYWDDWGVSSHTIGGKLSQYVTDEIVVRYRYRYYSQDPATFYSTDYTVPGGIDGYRTADYRLGDYGAHLFGGRVFWSPRRLLQRVGWLDRTQLIFSYEHYFNTNNFSANVFETGLRFTF